MKLDVGSIFKYHNHIIKVVKKTADTIVGEPHFFDNKIGNLQFNIPIEKVSEIDIVEIASKSNIQERLKNIAEEPATEGVIFLLDTDQPISKFNLDQTVDAIKGLADEKAVNKDNFSPNKNSKLKELSTIMAKEIGVSLNIDVKAAFDMVTKSIDKRLVLKRVKATV